MGMGLPRAACLQSPNPTDFEHLDALSLPVLQSLEFSDGEPLAWSRSIQTAVDKRNFPPVLRVKIGEHHYLLPHLHQGATRVVYAVGNHYVLKVGLPNRGEVANGTELDVAVDHAGWFPRCFRVNRSQRSILAERCDGNFEQILHKIDEEPHHGDLPAMLAGFIKWLRSLLIYAANNRLGVADFKPANIGYRISDCKWYCVDSGAFNTESVYAVRSGVWKKMKSDSSPSTGSIGGSAASSRPALSA